MKPWCGIQRTSNGQYIVIIPMLSGCISDNMMITNGSVTGRVLTRPIKDLDEAKAACKEWNELRKKWS